LSQERVNFMGLNLSAQASRVFVMRRAVGHEAYRIAAVLTAEQHPNADRLRVCTVDTGEGAPVQVSVSTITSREASVSRWSLSQERVNFMGLNLSAQGLEHYGFRPLDIPSLVGGLTG
jgi:predicted RNA-binding protein with EMAP domain